MASNDGEEFDTGPFNTVEIKRLRRMLQDDYYARKFRTVVKVWVITIGGIATSVAGVVTFWREVIVRFFGD